MLCLAAVGEARLNLDKIFGENRRGFVHVQVVHFEEIRNVLPFRHVNPVPPS